MWVPWRKRRKFYTLLSCATLACLLSACGGKLPDPPEDYRLGDERVASLTAVLGGEDSGTLTQMETPDMADGSASSSSGGAAADQCFYSYEKLPTGGATVQKYVDKLLADDSDFQVVDETGLLADPPDYTAETGQVALAKNASEEGKLFRLDISWTAEDCQITLTRPAGQVSRPPADPMTNDDAVGFLRSLGAAVLGLPGEGMEDYAVYPIEGSVMVDGIPCLKLRAYRLQGERGANEIMGTYLLSGDKVHLYRLENGRVAELPMS